MYKIERALAWTRENSDILFDIVRIYVGLGLAVRGFFALIDPVFLSTWLGQFGVTGAAASLAQAYIISAHLAGGLLLAGGFLTRVAALVNLPILAGAVFFIHFPEGLAATDQSLEFSALVTFLLALFVLRGSGRLSVMSRLRAKRLAQQE